MMKWSGSALLKLFLWGELFVPWLLLVFMKRSMIKRYMPVAIFVTLLITVVYVIAYHYKWWVLPVHLFPWSSITHDSFVFGPYLVGTLWIFRLTYPRFMLYMVTNIIVDGLFAFVFLQWTQWVGIDRLINITELELFLLYVALAAVIFVYQKWQEGIFKETEQPQNEQQVAGISRISRIRRRGKI
jgi:hypothetical protein